jgi:melibiose permease
MDSSKPLGAVTASEKFAYGLGALGKDLACSIVYVYLMYYYTDVVGLSAAFVGTLFLVARIWDAFNDPIMGMIVDNTRTRWGKFRPWILGGAVINSVFLVGVFWNTGWDKPWILVYASASYILWGMTYTLMDIPYWSMIPSLTTDPREREQIAVVPRLFASAAWFLMGSFGLQAVDFLGAGDASRGFLLLSVAIVAVFIGFSGLTAIKVRERIALQVNAPKIRLREVLGLIVKNDQLMALVGIVLTFNMATQLAGGFAIYYFTYAVGNRDLFQVFMMYSGAAEIAGLLLFPRLARGLSRPTVYFLACLFPALGGIGLWLAGSLAPQDALYVGLAGAFLKFGSGFALALSTVMLADVVDYGEYKLGVRSESVVFSVQTMLVKFASAFAGFLIGTGLTLIGYVPNQVQDADTIQGMRLLMIAIPFGLVVLSFVLYRFLYRLNGAFHDRVLRDLEARRTGQAVS